MSRKKFQWSREETDSEGELHFTERISRSDRKREVKRIDALAKALVSLKPDQIDRLEVPEDVHEAVVEAQRIKAKGRVRSGMRRQMLYLSGVLRGVDEDPLLELIERVERLNQKRR